MSDSHLLPTLVESPRHRPRPCPECGQASVDIRLDRCLSCRTPLDVFLVAQLVDAAREDAWRAWDPGDTTAPSRPPGLPNICSGCGHSVHGLAEGRCLSCRLGAAH